MGQSRHHCQRPQRHWSRPSYMNSFLSIKCNLCMQVEQSASLSYQANVNSTTRPLSFLPMANTGRKKATLECSNTHESQHGSEKKKRRAAAGVSRQGLRWIHGCMPLMLALAVPLALYSQMICHYPKDSQKISCQWGVYPCKTPTDLHSCATIDAATWWVSMSVVVRSCLLLANSG